MWVPHPFLGSSSCYSNKGIDTPSIYLYHMTTNGRFFYKAGRKETRREPCRSGPLHCGGKNPNPKGYSLWKIPRASVDRSGNRIRSQTLAQDRQRQENPISETKGQTGNAGGGACAPENQKAKEEVTNPNGQRPVLLAPNAALTNVAHLGGKDGCN